MTLVSSTSASEVEVPWELIHARMQYSPLCRRNFVENAFETWLTCSRPWSGNLREYPSLDCLFDLEMIAFQIAVEVYHHRTPQSRRSDTSRPSLLANGKTDDDDEDDDDDDDVHRVLEIFLNAF